MGLLRILTCLAVLDLLFLQFLPVFPAVGQEITMNGLARSASEFNAIRVFCSDIFPVNSDRAQKYELMYTELGIKSAGEKRFKAELAQEYSRRHEEVQITGVPQWCAYQRDHLAADAALFTKSTNAVNADVMAMLLGTLVTAQISCGLKTKDYPPLSSAVSRYGYNYSDFLPRHLFASVVEAKIDKAKEFMRLEGKTAGCRALIETTRRFFPELVD